MPDYSAYPPRIQAILRPLSRELAALIDSVATGGLDVLSWQREVERLLARYISASFMAGRGRFTLDESELAAVRKWVATQTGYLDKFAMDILNHPVEDGEDFPKKWRNRAVMYATSIVNAFYGGETWGIPLPAMPGDGTSQCVVSGDSRVITRNGLVAIKDIKPGDYVLTHSGNYREVTRAWKSMAGANRKAFTIKIPGWDNVTLTGDHLIMSENGWQHSNCIYNNGHSLYNVNYEMRNMSLKDGKQVSESDLSDVQESMSLREKEGCAGYSLHIVFEQEKGRGELGQCGIQGENQKNIGSETKEETRSPQDIHQGMGGCEREDSCRDGNSSHRPQQEEQRSGKSNNDDKFRPSLFARQAHEAGEMFVLSRRIQAEEKGQEGAYEILFSGVLLEDSEVYDITVDGDESFVIEGLIAHNCGQNDKCSWRIVKLDGRGNWDAYWTLHPAEHCQTCIERARLWNPLQIRDFVLLIPPDMMVKEFSEMTRRALCTN